MPQPVPFSIPGVLLTGPTRLEEWGCQIGKTNQIKLKWQGVNSDGRCTCELCALYIVYVITSIRYILKKERQETKGNTTKFSRE